MNDTPKYFTVKTNSTDRLVKVLKSLQYIQSRHVTKSVDIKLLVIEIYRHVGEKYFKNCIKTFGYA